MGREPRNAYKYIVLLDGKVIFRDITYGLEGITKAHKARYPGCRVVKVGRACTHKGASSWLRKFERRLGSANRS